MKRLFTLSTLVALTLLSILTGCRKEEPSSEPSVRYTITLSETSFKLRFVHDAMVEATITPEPPEGTILVWFSSDDEVVEAQEKEGNKARLYACAYDGLVTVTARLMKASGDFATLAEASCEVIVRTPQVQALEVPEKVYMNKYQGKYELTVKILPEEAADAASDLQFKFSGYPQLELIDQDGAKITIWSKYGVEYSEDSPAILNVSYGGEDPVTAQVKVITLGYDPPDTYPTGIKLTGFAEETAVDSPFTVDYSFVPNYSSVRECTATSSDASVARVEMSPDEESFTVTPLSAGETTVTVTYKTGASATKSVQKKLVVHSDAPSISWTTLPEHKYLVVSKTVSVAARVDNLINNAVEYTSSNVNIATVTAEGLVRGRDRGWVTITASAKANPNLKVEKDFFVYGSPYSIDVTLNKQDPGDKIWIRYQGNTKKLRCIIKDIQGYSSIQDLEILLEQVPGMNISYTTSEIRDDCSEVYVTLSNNRMSATETLTGTLTLSSKSDPSCKSVFTVYDMMYDSGDVKPFDALRFDKNGNYVITDGGYRGSGYFEKTAPSFSSADQALIVYVGGRQQTYSMLTDLVGIHHYSWLGLDHGIAVYKSNVGGTVQWWNAEASEGYAVFDDTAYKEYGMNVPTTDNGLYGYEISAKENYYNGKLSSKRAAYKVLPIQALQSGLPDTGGVSSKTNSGWYLPTSGEWYRMLHCMGSSQTVPQTRSKINTYLEAMGGTVIGAVDPYWSCQESVDNPETKAVYMTGNEATQYGKKPTQTANKNQNHYYVRPFIAF
ncbi:MAG: Ig-like domain-containing protein [Bacteroidales bacterium]|nr:Ig-like domain-containing protein [Bacteroidales bacterium]